MSFDADGKAQEFDNTYVQLTYSYLSAKWIFVTNVGVGQRDYNNINPVYGIEQDGDTFIVDASILYRLPYDQGRWQLVGSLFWADIDSDIDFHDNKVTRAVMLLQYNFGAMPGIK